MSYASALINDMTSAPTNILARRKTLFYCAMAAVVLAFVVVVLGAFTRLSNAGLGCPDWPGCYGHLTWPSSSEDVSKAEAKFPESPVEHDKTWPEMVHRHFAGSLGLLILAIAILSWRSTSAVPQKLPRFIVGLVVLQAAFGMWTVTLKLWPQIVTAHLLGGFATLTLLWLLAQRLSHWRWHFVEAQSGTTRMLAVLTLMLVILQIILGGWTSTNYAALACPDLPTCHGVWWPDADFGQGFNVFQQVGPNYLGGLLDNHARTAIHWVHRLGAIVVALVVCSLARRLWSSGVKKMQTMGAILLAILIVQLALGLSNVHWALPLPVAVAHNAIAAVLLLALVTVNHRVRTNSLPSPNQKS